MAVVVLAACAATPPAGDKGELERRVSAWWTARIGGDLRGMYALYDPSFRARTPFEDYATQAAVALRIRLDAFHVDAIDYTPGATRALVKLVAPTRLPRTGQQADLPIQEEWTFVEGQWWKVYVPPRTPFELYEEAQRSANPTAPPK